MNVFYNSSWCLFSTDLTNPEDAHYLNTDYFESMGDDLTGGQPSNGMNGNGAAASMEVEENSAARQKELEDRKRYMPYKFSGKNYSFEGHERKRLDRLREWALEYFASAESLYKDVPIARAEEQKGDFDLMCKVMKVVEKDDYTYEIRVRDASQETWFCLVQRLKYPHVKKGEIIRMRSVVVDENAKRKTFRLNAHSNILRFMSNTKFISELEDEIGEEEDTDRILLENEIVTNSVISKRRAASPRRSQRGGRGAREDARRKAANAVPRAAPQPNEGPQALPGQAGRFERDA